MCGVSVILVVGDVVTFAKIMREDTNDDKLGFVVFFSFKPE